MAVQKKRKHTFVEEEASKQTTGVKIQQSIKAFGSVAKTNVPDNGSKRRKMSHQREATPPPSLHAQPDKSEKKRKRKLEIVDEEDIFLEDPPIPATNQGIFKRFPQKEVSTPGHKRFKKIHPLSPIGTPSKSTAALFGKLNLDASTKPIPFALGNDVQPYKTPPDTPESTTNGHCLPSELSDLLSLQAGFLSALSMYYAHNGISSPVNIRTLLPMITKHWRKRTVSLHDLRVLLALDKGNEASFVLKDFGKAGICLGRSQPRGRATKRAASYVDEVDLNARFETALRKKWVNWVAAAPKENYDVTLFIDQLPQVEISKSDSMEKTAPLLARGQQRLADLKAGQAAAKSKPVVATDVSVPQKTNHAVQSRGTSLLNRILAKQAHMALLPAGPTKDQLERKAALQRVEEIARVLELLAGGRARCSFSMTAIQQHLQQSLRNPISKEEIERCLSLMAVEIMPAFVSLLQSGAVTGVVVTKGGRIGLEELRLRVLDAGG